MTATNHTLTGALIAAVVPNPIMAICLAFMAHFVLDALPHFAFKDTKSSKFLYFLSADMGVAAAILLALFLLHPPHWALLIAGGIACASPDLMWLRYLIHDIKGQKLSLGPIARFHAKVQWAEIQNIKGLVAEIIWLAGVGVAFINVLTI